MLEIIIKILAAMLMIGSGYFFGKSLNEKLRERYETLNKLLQAVNYLKNKIYAEGLTLPEALKATDFKYYNSEKSLFRLSAYEIEKSADSETAWAYACEQNEDRVFLKDSDVEMLKSAGKLLGSGDSNVQKENLENLAELLKNTAEEAEQKQKKDGTLYIKLGLAIGSIVAVVMW